MVGAAGQALEMDRGWAGETGKGAFRRAGVGG